MKNQELNESINKILSVEVGGTPLADILQQLKSAGVVFSPQAEEVIASKDFTHLEHPQMLSLVMPSVEEIGLKRGSPGTEVFKPQRNGKLDICPPETALYIIRTFLGSPDTLDFYQTVAMKPITTRDGHAHVLSIQRQSHHLMLSTDLGDASSKWNSSAAIIYKLQKK